MGKQKQQRRSAKKKGGKKGGTAGQNDGTIEELVKCTACVQLVKPEDTIECAIPECDRKFCTEKCSATCILRCSEPGCKCSVRCRPCASGTTLGILERRMKQKKGKQETKKIELSALHEPLLPCGVSGCNNFACRPCGVFWCKCCGVGMCTSCSVEEELLSKCRTCDTCICFECDARVFIGQGLPWCKGCVCGTNITSGGQGSDDKDDQLGEEMDKHLLHLANYLQNVLSEFVVAAERGRFISCAMKRLNHYKDGEEDNGDSDEIIARIFRTPLLVHDHGQADFPFPATQHILENLIKYVEEDANITTDPRIEAIRTIEQRLVSQSAQPDTFSLDQQLRDLTDDFDSKKKEFERVKSMNNIGDIEKGKLKNEMLRADNKKMRLENDILREENKLSYRSLLKRDSLYRSFCDAMLPDIVSMLSVFPILEMTVSHQNVLIAIQEIHSDIMQQLYQKEMCGYCLRPIPGGDETKRCGGCLAIRYCDKKCQALSWPVHREHCQRMNMVRSEYNAKLVEIAVGNVEEAKHQASLIRTRASFRAFCFSSKASDSPLKEHDERKGKGPSE